MFVALFLLNKCKYLRITSMVILKESVLSQTFKFIPRVYEADTLVLKNETTGVEVVYEITPTIDRYYLVVSEILDLEQNTFYQMTIKNGLEVVYKDKVFCTNQNVDSYSVNNNTYVSVSSNNDYITYE